MATEHDTGDGVQKACLWSGYNNGPPPVKKSRELKPGQELSLLIIGKTGNGKSTVGNILLGKNCFGVGRGMASTTTQASVQEAERDGYRLKVVDTPDASNTDVGNIKHEIDQWKKLSSPGPDAVLLPIKCDVIYTPEELAIYRQVKRHWGDNSLADRLVVVFTFGDRLDRDIKEEVKAAKGTLKEILTEAGGRYAVFNSKATEQEKMLHIKILLDAAEQLSFGPFCRIMIIGKTGNGKSTLANMLLGKQLFPVGRGMATTTSNAEVFSAQHAKWKLKILDTPDISNLNLSEDEASQAVQHWNKLVHPGAQAILLVVSCDCQFTKEQYDLYCKVKKLLGDSQLTKRLIVAFTFGDCLTQGISDELKQASEQLQQVLKDASDRYFVFKGKASERDTRLQVKKFLEVYGDWMTNNTTGWKARVASVGVSMAGTITKLFSWKS